MIIKIDINKHLFRSVFTLVLLIFTGCSRGLPAQTEFVLGTICNVNLFEKGTQKRYAVIFARLREIEEVMSANKAGTELDRINQNAGIGPVPVDAELIAVLDRALRYAEASGGAFDPTVGPLVKLWGIGSDAARVPAQDEIDRALALIDWRDLIIDKAAGTAFLRRPGMALDLGAIAKGYAADEAVRLAKGNGVKRALIDLGGNILAMGARRGGNGLWPGKSGAGGSMPWRIGIQDPRDNRGAYIGILQVINKSIVTSGIYERFFEDGGKRYHHLLSTKDGYPVYNGLLSVTIIADQSIDADSLSTSAFTLGYEKGRALVESVPGTDAIFIFDDLSIRLTPGAAETFALSSDTYHLDQN
ncbi:FAD:protein FMN transferase [Spirochaetia bacterium]|nr:FAD:protein FMN transferase [Spirochaetia bacterium]